jgi:hypothetical protein
MAEHGLFGSGYGWGDVAGDVGKGIVDWGIGELLKDDPKDIGKATGEQLAEIYKRQQAAIRSQIPADTLAWMEQQGTLVPYVNRLAYEQTVGSEEAKNLPAGYFPGDKERAQIEADVDFVKRFGASGTDLDILRMKGPYMAQAYKEQLGITDAPWMDTRETGAQKIQELLGSINMGGLSGGERAEVERMNARRNLQRGQAGGGGNLTAIENAMQFGSALDRKRAALGQALQTATNFMIGSRSGYDPIQATLGRPSGTGQATGQFQGVQPTMPTIGSNLMSGLQPTGDTGVLGTMQKGAEFRTSWLNPGSKKNPSR